MARRKIKYYSDFKSPYAYLAKDLVYALEEDTGAEIDWLPYTLDIPAYLGSAEVDGGRVVAQNRNAHQWRRVKYSYMDYRREANLRGLTIRGPRKIFDSSLSHIGLLYAKQGGDPRPYIDRVFDRFWKRELDIEDPLALADILGECGIDAGGFADYCKGAGRELLERVQADAEAQGVFGVPSFLLDDGDLYWGREHLPRIRELLSNAPAGP
jgi:2-hydroxychromene-2-carboxylate isomerase